MRQTIEQKLESVPTSVQLDDEESASLTPLQALADRIAAATSIAHIAQAEATRVKAKALDHIKRAGGGEEPDPSKPLRVIRPSRFMDTGYPETKQDVDAFLEKLRRELHRMISEDARIEIR